MNQKTLWIILAVVIVVILGFWLFTRNGTGGDSAATTTPEEASTTPTLPANAVMEDGAGGPTSVRGVYTDGTYALDTEKSSVAWTGYKTLIKEYADHGTFSFASGSVVVTNGHIASGEFIVDMNSLAVLSTSNTKSTADVLEGHLASADFFDVATYPTATVKIQNVVNGIVSADVTMKGVTKTISFPATVTQTGNTLSASADLSINRALWNIQYGSDTFFDNLGNSVIGDRVDITLSLSAVRQ